MNAESLAAFHELMARVWAGLGSSEPPLGQIQTAELYRRASELNTGTEPWILAHWLFGRLKKRRRPRTHGSLFHYALTCIRHNWARPRKKDFTHPVLASLDLPIAPAEFHARPRSTRSVAGPVVNHRPRSSDAPKPATSPPRPPRRPFPKLEFQTVRGWSRLGPNRELLERLHEAINHAWDDSAAEKKPPAEAGGEILRE